MLEPSAYAGREQTYVKHLFLDNYLERVAYNIYSFRRIFTYVDGFSGPWKSDNDRYDDTSFSIAINQLRSVRDGMKQNRGKDVDFRCMFIEKGRTPFKELEAAVGNIQDVSVKLVHGSFEDNVDGICEFAKGTFSLIFIDPTGWQGFSLRKITPLLNLRGEVLINFMSDFINRFLEDPRPEIAATFDALFGDEWYPEWRKYNEAGLSREAAAVEVYKNRVKKSGNFRHVTSTRILKPTIDRSYFYLVYATQHWKGIQEFRAVEKRVVNIQENVRNAAKISETVSKTGQENLFSTGKLIDLNKNYEIERAAQLELGEHTLRRILNDNPEGVKYEDLLGEVLETPLVWESDLKLWLSRLHKDGHINIPELAGKQRVPRVGYHIVPN